MRQGDTFLSNACELTVRERLFFVLETSFAFFQKEGETFPTCARITRHERNGTAK